MQPTFQDFSVLRENPSNMAPDSRFLVVTDNVRRTFIELTHAIHARMGLILLTGEVGTGKTVLMHLLLDHLRQEGIYRAFIFNPHLNANELFTLVLADFGVAQHPNMNVTPAARLQHWLAEPERLSGNAVLIIDEAQGLLLEVLEEIRLLLNMDAARGKTLQVILAGQPELDEKLRRPEFRAIRQRISVRCNTKPLSRGEADEYINRRHHAGGSGSAIAFPSEAADLLYLYSRGVPRVLNLLCEHSSMRARAARSGSVSLEMVEEVARQLQFDDDRPVTRSVRVNRVVEAGMGYRVSEPIAVSSHEAEVPGVGRIEMKYPAIEFPGAFISRLALVPDGAAAERLNRAKALYPTVAPAATETLESAPIVSMSEPGPMMREEKRPGEARCEIETADAPTSSERLHRNPNVWRKSARPILYRIKRDAGRFWRSMMALAIASIRRVRRATRGTRKPWNQAWEIVLRWLHEPMRAGRARLRASRITGD